MQFINVVSSGFVIPMHYTISYQNPADHFVDIELVCTIGSKPLIDLLLPAWRPGRYELANYARNIRMMGIRGTRDKSLPFKKVSRNQWRVTTKGTTVIKVYYQYYANQPDAGGSLLDRRQLYLNFINCLLYIEDKLPSPCTVDLKTDREFKIACALPRKGRKLMARSYFSFG